MVYERPFEELIAASIRAKIELEEIQFAVKELNKSVRRRRCIETLWAARRIRALGMNMHDAAKHIGISKQLLSAFMNGRKSLSIDRYLKFLELSRGPKNH